MNKKIIFLKMVVFLGGVGLIANAMVNEDLKMVVTYGFIFILASLTYLLAIVMSDETI